MMRKIVGIFYLSIACCFSYGQDMDPGSLAAKILENNFDVKISRLSHEESLAGLLSKVGPFDTKLSYSFTYNDKETPSSSSLDGTGSATAIKSKDKIHQLSLAKNFTFGTEISVPYSYKVNKSNSSYKRIPESHEPTLELKLKQPLIKSFTPTYFQKELLGKKIEVAESLNRHKEEITDVLYRGLMQFFDVVEHSSLLKIKKLAMEVAQESHQLIQKKREVGQASLIELLDSESNLRKAQEEYQTQLNHLLDKEDELRKLAEGSRESYQSWNLQLPPLPPLLPKHSFEEMFNEALNNRPEIKSQQLLVERDHQKYKFSQVDLWPNLDLELEKSLKGLGRDFSSANDQVWDGKYTSDKIGVTLDYPLMGYAAKGAHQLNALKLKQEELKNLELKRDIAFEVEKVLRDLQLNWEKRGSYQLALKAEEEKLKLMMKSFELGKISSYDLHKNLQSKVQTEMKLLQAEITIHKKTYELLKIRGTLLEAVLGQIWKDYESHTHVHVH